MIVKALLTISSGARTPVDSTVNTNLSSLSAIFTALSRPLA